MMYFVCSGALQYVSIGGTVTIVQAVQWISEATLWTPWMHMGVLTATSECRLVTLDASWANESANMYVQRPVGLTEPKAFDRAQPQPTPREASRRVKLWAGLHNAAP